MTRSNSYRWRRVVGTAGLLGMLWAMAGCGGDAPDVVPVSGRVTVDGEPLRAKTGVINFVPDKDKGNTTTFEPAGYLDEDGNYTLYYAKGKKGAPVGWYKVQVVATDQATQEGGAPMPTPKPKKLGGKIGGGPPPAKPLFNNKFTRAQTSGLAVEVVRDPAPGAYDLKLTK